MSRNLRLPNSTPIEQRAGSERVEDRETAGDFALAWIANSLGVAERRQVVVLACGFAPAADARDDPDPERIAELLERRRRAVLRQVERHCGVLELATPEIMTASWGWHCANDDDPRRAVAAALAIASELGPAHSARCGIDCAIAISETAAGKTRGASFVSSAIGGSLGLLADCSVGRVAISGAARRLIGDQYSVRTLIAPTERAAGRAVAGSESVTDRSDQPVAIVEAARSDPFTYLPPGGRLIGRGPELRLLEAAWNEVRGLECSRLVRIEGEAGIGKSALVAMLNRIVVAQGGHWLEARCLPETQMEPMIPIVALVASLSRDLQPGERLPTGDDSTDTAIAGLATANGLIDRLCLLRRRHPRQGVAIVLEDLHWADASTLDAVDHLARNIKRIPGVLILLTTRRVSRLDASQPAAHTSITLDRLSPSDLAAMLADSRFALRSTPDLIGRLARLAAGNPLNAWDLARLVDSLGSEPLQLRLMATPNRLNGGLAARLDALGAKKPLLKAAAVIGRDFDKRWLAALLDIDVRAIDVHFHQLIEHGVLARSDERNANRLSFVDALTWNQCYGSVPRATRLRLHGLIARELAARWPDVARERPDIIAHHMEVAADHSNAFVWWRRAALKARTEGPATAAMAWAEKAIDASNAAPTACPPADVAEVVNLIVNSLATLKGNSSPETLASYERAVGLVSALAEQPRALAFDIGWGLASIHFARGDLTRSLQASARLIEQGDQTEMPAALRIDATARLHCGQIDEAIERLSRAVALYDPDCHAGLRTRIGTDPGAVSLAFLAMALAISGDDAGSVRAERGALRMTSRAGHSPTSATVLGILATAAEARGDYSTIAVLAHAANAHGRGWQQQHWSARARVMMGWVAARRDPEWALAMVSNVLQQYDDSQAVRASIMTRCLLADIALQAGRPALALEALQLVRRSGEIEQRRLYASVAMRLDALARLQMGVIDREPARGLIDEARSVAIAQGALAFAARAAISADELKLSDPMKSALQCFKKPSPVSD